MLRESRGQVRVVGGWVGRGVLTLQFEDWVRLTADPSAHSAVSVLLDCLLRSYSFSYVEKKSLERQRNRAGTPTLTEHATSPHSTRVHPQCVYAGRQTGTRTQRHSTSDVVADKWCEPQPTVSLATSMQH